MPRSIQIYIPPGEFEWYHSLLDKLADEVIADDEAGQRGAKVSAFVRMILTGYVVDPDQTVKRLLAIKKSALEPPRDEASTQSTK